jgi:hypothetical protein
MSAILADQESPNAGGGRGLRGTKYLYIEHHSVCPLVGIGTPLTPLPQASEPSTLDHRVGGHTRLRLRGWGCPNSDDWRKA